MSEFKKVARSLNDFEIEIEQSPEEKHNEKIKEIVESIETIKETVNELEAKHNVKNKKN